MSMPFVAHTAYPASGGFARIRESSRPAMARGAFVEIAGVPQPAPAPRFSRTPGGVARKPPERGEGGRAALADWGFAGGEIEQLESLGLGFR